MATHFSILSWRTPWTEEPGELQTLAHQAPLSMEFPRTEILEILEISRNSRNTRVGCLFLLQGIFLTRGVNPHLLHWQVGSLSLSHLGSADHT